MNGPPKGVPFPSGKGLNVRAVIIAVFALILAGWVGFLLLQDGSPTAKLGPLAVGSMEKFEVFKAPRTLPETLISDRTGKLTSLQAFRGKATLVNFWATWCEPCRIEMPSLSRLKAALGNEDFEVVTVSLDLQGYSVIDPFLSEIGVSNLAVYWDRSNRLPAELETKGLPMTILIDGQGEWIGRLDGPTEWDTPDAITFMKAAAKD